MVAAAQARIEGAVRNTDRVWRAGHRRIAVDARGVDQTSASAFVTR